MAQIKIRGITNIYTIRENEALEIKDVWEKDIYRPDHKISIGPISFKKGDIQLIQLEENNVFQKGINLSDPIKREEIKQFEKDFLTFCETQSQEKQTFNHWLIELKIINFIKLPCVAQSGLEGFDLGSMILHKPETFNDYSQKWNALQTMKGYRARQLLTEIQNAKETMFEMSDEINVKDIPF
mgnify:CR=1 FL=1